MHAPHDPGHHHDHGHGSSHQHGPSPGSSTRAFATVTLVNLAYTVLEAGYGFLTNSLALLSDALHNLGDVLGLALAWGAAAMAQWPATERHTYGWRRATLLSPLANATLLVGLSGALAWEALRRLSAPPELPGMTIVVVATIGIAVNLGSALLVQGGHGHDLNRRGAYLHLLADAAISLATVVAGIGMLAWGWTWLDPATALLVGVVVAVGAARLLRDSFDAAMDAVPTGIDQAAVRTFLAAQAGVDSVHHVHIWSLGAGEVAMTAHLVRPSGDDDDRFLHDLGASLAARFGIGHATLQVERSGAACGGHEHDGGVPARE
ncbi:cation diffusion facilitator family transporter [Luteimonas sp. MC1825]|uniref:cation diffusion facilitator family transporter n=1 Tax=Luteimonas sp. MC1825 TaxID=2761107 RepID=UPI001608A405|nr:cation diffusion facilitator family transporter [Luteimonas sp. MC1825]MBB6599169.1 cation transporter [Luteimonas sp. MC1825]QOC89291.1 cation transporter [Luteimonas sp. MC1825]